MGCSFDGIRFIYTVSLFALYIIYREILIQNTFLPNLRYGIEGIAQTYEDPFGVAKIDINMDDIVEDARREVEVILLAWQNQGNRGGIFRPHGRDLVTSETSSECFNNDRPSRHSPEHSLLRVVVSDLGHQIESDAAERERQRITTLPSNTSIRALKSGRGASSDSVQVSASASEDTPLLGVADPRKGSDISPGTSVNGNSYMRSHSIGNQDRLDPGDSSGPRISWSDNLPGSGKPAL